MAGHSKWANIKHRKGRADAQKGKIFSRIAKEIISAVKLGGSDQKNNAKLRVAIEKARAANMPNENVERNIKKAANIEQSNYTEIVYEIYGHGGVGIIVEAMTDNKNRFSSDMRIATNKCGGSIANPGAVVFNFDRQGIIQMSKNQDNEEALFQKASDAGAVDFDIADDIFIIVTAPNELYSIKKKFDDASIKCLDANITMVPKTMVEVDAETAQANTKLIEWLENLEDVDAVYHNMQSA